MNCGQCGKEIKTDEGSVRDKDLMGTVQKTFCSIKCHMKYKKKVM